VATYGITLAAPAEGLTHLFPEPAALVTADLTRIGLTRKRALAVNALAEAVAGGSLCFHDAAADDVREQLRRIPGIGAWTAEYIAMRALADPDAFPAGDLVLQRQAGRGRRLTEKALLHKAEAWRPWRAYAVLHLWRSASDKT
jgi:AraC family transcriptional regulator of adaptative response / DNA-3-methyladenine glycosylase II